MRRLIAPLLLCILLLVGVLPPGHADGTDQPLLQQILTGLARHHAVRADFVQTRSNPALARPQTSHGQLLFVLGHGMLWQTVAPYAETLAFTGTRAARIDAQGRAQRMHDARGVSQISQMLQAMLAGHVDTVRRQFDISASGTASAWTLRLVPKQERVARVLGSIVLSGDAFLQDIRIAMRDGGGTDIRFSHSRDAARFNPLEKQVLGLP
ncbi:outer membrane lipoprotein carrier protein LolA [Dyella sp. A6]|uniref:outer membrane lipoprotein carrier protein LolA n=1 Tax=Dyella aluminiiresistens TaxID=3069105 RepID=UPI002E75B4A3|nr:outer membrane lipoprotein carrier protein LolA [Dyella sp. A6]